MCDLIGSRLAAFAGLYIVCHWLLIGTIGRKDTALPHKAEGDLFFQHKWN